MKNKMKNRVIEMKDLCLLWLFLFLLGGIPAGATTISDNKVASGSEELIAFPGAEGFGRNTTGGRGGKVYHVTTLEDGMQAGTLRYALAQTGTRTVVFDVAGTIFLNRPLRITNGDLTIAGQTAPGQGICIARRPVTINANNVIVRYVRFRVGNEGGGEPDGLGSTDCKNVIVDHCSISWSVDECCSVYGGENLTVQWCLVSESLRTAGGHVAGLDLLRSGEGFVGVAGFEQLGCDVLIDVATLGLAVRAVRATHVDAFIPVDAQPIQGLDDLVVAFLGVALGVRILDTEHERALGVAGLSPVEQCGADHADVRNAGRGRAETHTNVFRKFRFGIFNFSHRLHCAAQTGRATTQSPFFFRSVPYCNIFPYLHIGKGVMYEATFFIL